MLKPGGGRHILQISRLISLAGFGERVPAAHRQALNTEAGVTVAERRWPPLIQSAPAGVITNRDYPNVHCTVGLDLPAEEVKDCHHQENLIIQERAHISDSNILYAKDRFIKIQKVLP